MSEGTFARVAEIEVDPAAALVYELGWQTCSPSVAYRLDERPHRPTSRRNACIGFRPDRPIPDGVFQGEGLLAVRPADGEPVHLVAVRDAHAGIPSIRARRAGDRLVVTAEGPVEHLRADPQPASSAAEPTDRKAAFDPALAAWADRFASTMDLTVRPSPSLWCSWYRYFDAVTEADVVENVDAIDRLALPVDVVQLDDGWQRCVGDWATSARFGSLERLVGRIHATGRRAGIWLAPFLVRAASETARRHPERLVVGEDGPLWIGRNWGDDLFALDSTNEAAWAPVLERLRALRAIGFDLFKLDFLYAGAVDGRRAADVPTLVAYRAALASIRDAIGDAYVLGAGPLLASVGFVDAFRTAPDIAVATEPDDGDMSQPSVRTAVLTGRGRAWTHGRLFASDPDCLIARPSFDRRADWLAHLRRWAGMRGASDRVGELDGWGLDATREWLASPPPAVLVPSGQATLRPA